MPTALLDLREADAFFQAQRAADPATALQAYRQHMLERAQEPLADGTAMPLVAADELEGLLETTHLLRSPRNAARLLAALERAQAETLPASPLEELEACLEG